MPITYFDIAVIVLVLLSALFAMSRGLSREVLSLLSVVVALLVTYFFYPYSLPTIGNYISDEKIALVVALVAIFLLTLIVVSILFIKLSNWILNSKIGALDRTLGFIYGLARGTLIATVIMIIINFLYTPKHQPEWISQSKTQPFLNSLSQKLQEVLPTKFAEITRNYLKKKQDDTDPEKQ